MMLPLLRQLLTVTVTQAQYEIDAIPSGFSLASANHQLVPLPFDLDQTAIRDDDPTTPPPSTPSPPTSSPPQDDCGPCSSEGHPTYTSPSGKQCYCIGGSTDPWEWADKNCINDVTGLPNDEGRPYLCLGSGSTPSSRACLVSHSPEDSVTAVCFSCTVPGCRT